MSREKKATYMIDYLEKRINCENIMDFADKTSITNLDNENNITIQKLMVDNIPVAFEIIKYNDIDNPIMQNDPDFKNRKSIKKLFNIFDFMTEANYTGFEYFPYIYGVLDCHNNENSKVYIFYEAFDGTLIDLINNMEHPSEWYDIVFQMIMINYYIVTINGYHYDNGSIENHLYKKLNKPYYKEYLLNSSKFNINHKYLIVLWNIDNMVKNSDINEYQFISNIDYLLTYLDENKDKIKIPPSPRIMNLLNDIKNNSINIIDILSQYYIQTEKK